MFTSLRRIGIFTVLLSFAATTAAFASISIWPSDSITLPTLIMGVGGNQAEASVTITAESQGVNAVRMTAGTCKQRDLVYTRGYVTRSHNINGTITHTATIQVLAKEEPGTCTLTFSDGPETAVVHIRIVNP